MILKSIRCGLPALMCLLLFSCQKNEAVTETAYVRKYWNELASSFYEVPATRTAEVKARMFLNLMTDNTFYYDILLDTAMHDDVLTGAGLYYGTAASKGSLLTDLKPAVNGRHLIGSVSLTDEQATAMMSKPVFLNVQSKGSPAGIVRLQLEKNIDWYTDINLDGASVIPGVTSKATGKVVLRITTDKVLHYQVMIDGVDAGDVLQEAHVHAGAAGTNGAKQLTLATAAADYNVEKSAAGLADAILTLIKTLPAYVDVHSASYAAGLVRGQLR